MTAITRFPIERNLEFQRAATLAWQTYAAAVRLFQQSPTPEVAEVVTAAFHTFGFLFLCDSERAEQVNRRFAEQINAHLPGANAGVE